MKPRVGVYKFSSCDGCQLAFLNAGLDLIVLSQKIEFVHFVEAGLDDENALVDIAFVEGSISTKQELNRIKNIRKNARIVITIGACATSGGLQALRNGKDINEWMRAIYASPEYIDSLECATPIKEHIKVDHELWGCPISTKQILDTIGSLTHFAMPASHHESLCLECKRQGNVCVLITQKAPCLGPVTKTGCGALCPSAGRACYACYGPSENATSKTLKKRFEGFGLMTHEVAQLFNTIYSHEKAFKENDS
jgi:coenzyme F420-reducing hydrogenase gamma subunit